MFFVMKLSKQCNLRCTYCYEYDELGVADRMPLDALEDFFRGLAEDPPAVGWPELRFVFHAASRCCCRTRTSRR